MKAFKSFLVNTYLINSPFIETNLHAIFININSTKKMENNVDANMDDADEDDKNYEWEGNIGKAWEILKDDRNITTIIQDEEVRKLEQK